MKNIDKKIFIAKIRDHTRRRHVDLSQYTHIRAYHACRPQNVGSYLNEGVKPFDRERMHSIASDLFGLSTDEVVKSEGDLETFDGRAYFNLFKKELLKHSGHYLVWGSEYLLKMAVELDQSNDGKYHNVLLRTGIPTIFTCDIPISMLKQEEAEDISRSYSKNHEDLSCWLFQPLPPEYIVGHDHPREMFDPIRWRKYINSQFTCPYC
ncbi:MAG: hypothetical protein EOM12_08795 [Verrucomicrobiae bacterium]|nr:hypothetical protein [Verrucomicrobiae bacterium]